MTTSETTKARNDTAIAESKTADDKRKIGRSEGAAEAAKAVKADKASQAETKIGITAEIKHLRATTNMAPKKAMDDNNANKAAKTLRRNHSASQPTESTVEFLDRIEYMVSRATSGAVSTTYAMELNEDMVELWSARARWDNNLDTL